MVALSTYARQFTAASPGGSGVANVLSGIDPATIESTEMVRSDHGDIMRIRRCHAATTH
ncbi:MAG TPA: hypothetical protein VGH98_18280 [Gemmatimonadaceae bacterium]